VDWLRGRRPSTTWSVVDLETTGLYARSDRIVEIAVLQLDPQGNETKAWTTLLDPQRDVGATWIHGLSMRDLAGAPRFGDVAPEIFGLLGGRVLVAHNVRFDVTFLEAEARRIGMNWGPVNGVDTMVVPWELRMTTQRSLEGCCRSLGVEPPVQRSALDGARAVARILRRLLPPKGYSVPAACEAWSLPPHDVSVRLRTDQPLPLVDSNLGRLASRVGIPEGVEAPPAAALAYMDLLDRVLEDRRVMPEEAAALRSLAGDWGLSIDAVDTLHTGYVAGVLAFAWADGVLTKSEQDDLETVAELLGVDLASVTPTARYGEVARQVIAPPPSPTVPRAPFGTAPAELLGKSVCFTGESCCTYRGTLLSRHDQEMFAGAAGMVVKSGVSHLLDVLVLADPESRSGKARKADELGVRKIAEPAFWHALGVPID
jgi:DNA polymerase-3 subunit epsilon